MRKIMAFALAGSVISTGNIVTAMERPSGGNKDHRVRYINYNAREVVELVAHYGFITHIRFGDDEVISHVALGDVEAWTTEKDGNHLFLKPVAEEATTNMVILTNSRAYNFELNAHWSNSGARPRDMMFQINFRYPEEEKRQEEERKAQLARAQELLEANQNLNSAIDTRESPRNWNYWGQGVSDIIPTRVWDDGRFTFMSFSNNRDMPAIYVEDESGNESLINTNVEGDTIVVHVIARKFVLRLGDRVAAIHNFSYDPFGATNEAGTSRPAIRRILRDE